MKKFALEMAFGLGLVLFLCMGLSLFSVPIG